MSDAILTAPTTITRSATQRRLLDRRRARLPGRRPRARVRARPAPLDHDREARHHRFRRGADRPDGPPPLERRVPGVHVAVQLPGHHQHLSGGAEHEAARRHAVRAGAAVPAHVGGRHRVALAGRHPLPHRDPGRDRGADLLGVAGGLRVDRREGPDLLRAHAWCSGSPCSCARSGPSRRRPVSSTGARRDCSRGWRGGRRPTCRTSSRRWACGCSCSTGACCGRRAGWWRCRSRSSARCRGSGTTSSTASTRSRSTPASRTAATSTT